MVRITFKSEEDHANGLYCLALNGRVRCLRGGEFELQRHMLEHLDREGVRYSIVAGRDIREEDKIRNTPAIAV